MSIHSCDETNIFQANCQPDGKQCPPFPHHDIKNLKPSYARETSKNIDIFDKFGKLRYVVELTSKWCGIGQRGYKVTVAQMLKNGLKVFLQIPDREDNYEYDYNVAIETFNTCVKKYQSLIDAEMRDFRDIDVYSENIGYKVQHVECCQSCRWCIKTFPRKDPNTCCKKPIKLQCGCPNNEQVFNYAQPFPQVDHCNKTFNSWQKLPWQKPDDVKSLEHMWGKDWDPRKFPNVMFPVVQPLGICDNYAHGDGFLQYGPPHTPPQYQIASNIAAAFDQTKEYEVGNMVYHDGKLYVCTKDHKGNWNDDDFVLTTVSDQLQHTVHDDILSGETMHMDPRQREIADIVEIVLKKFGGKIIHNPGEESNP